MKAYSIFILSTTIALISLNASARQPNMPSIYVTNQTSQKISFSIDHACIASIGTSKPHENKVIPPATLAHHCERDQSACVATAHTGDSCSGKQIAGVKFSLETLDSEFFDYHIQHIYFTGSDNHHHESISLFFTEQNYSI